MVFQVGISRLLLNVRTSQIFAAQGQATVDEGTYLGREIPLREVVSQQERDATQASRLVVAQESIDRRDEEANTEFPSSFLSYQNERDGNEWPRDEDDADCVRREIRRIHPNPGCLQKRFWWMHRSEIADIHIDIMHPDNQGDDPGESTGGVKLSRLGRLDGWL